MLLREIITSDNNERLQNDIISTGKSSNDCDCFVFQQKCINFALQFSIVYKLVQVSSDFQTPRDRK